MSRSLFYHLLLSLLLFTLGCDEEPSPAQERETLPTPEADTQGGVDDQGPVSADQAPAGPPPHLESPRARVFLSDPLNEEGELSEVELTQTRFSDGRLTSDAVEVFNCLNEEGGIGGPVDFGGIQIEVYLCREEQTLRPDPDGHYLSVGPPDVPEDPNDSFAELMMYYHVNKIADYYRDRFELVLYDEPLPALVNVQFTTKPILRLPGAGFTPGPDGFIPLDNALFFPKEGWEAFASQFGFPPRDRDLIAFFQGQVDFAYDASVIYHEYTHAVIGINRLQGLSLDSEGVDASPGGMNEGLADYFAASALDLSEVGRYGIGSVDPRGGRDLSDDFRCGEDSHWEVHEEGRIIGSTLWALRSALGADFVDEITYRMLEGMSAQSGHRVAAALLLDEAERLGRRGEVEAILEERTFVSCPRLHPWRDWDAARSRNLLPDRVLSTGSLGVPGLRPIGAPAFKQLTIEGGEAAALQLRWRVGAGGGGPGGFGGGQQSPRPLHLALRRGVPISLSYSPAEVEADLVETSPIDEDGWQSLTIAGDCLPAEGEQLYTLFMNRSGQDADLLSLRIDRLDTLPEEGLSCAAVPIVDGGVVDLGAPSDMGPSSSEMGADAGLPEVDLGLAADLGE
ncbi:MAG: M36 family metallopeptidase [Myxococcota bacterium]|nr:M36 family metallopeptidase [Myxococcota bacterium]